MIYNLLVQIYDSIVNLYHWYKVWLWPKIIVFRSNLSILFVPLQQNQLSVGSLQLSVFVAANITN